MHGFIQNFLPSSFNNTWVKNAIRNIGENDIQLRNLDQLRLTHVNLTSLDLFPLYNFPKLWQDFPDEQIIIICKCKPSEFDAKLKDFFLDDLASNVVCNRLFCPACPPWFIIVLVFLFSLLLFYTPVCEPCFCLACLILSLASIIYLGVNSMELSYPSPLKFTDPHGLCSS